MTAGTAEQGEAPPLVQSILWMPRKLATGVAPAVAADLVFAQRALKQAREHAASSPNAPVGGILLGRVREDPSTGRQWVLIEAVVRAKRLLPEDSSAEILWAALAEVIDPEKADSVVGWYRTHARTGVYLSEQEARLHEACFAERWQCAVILAGTAEHPVGGVFQRAETGSLSRSGYTAFYELIDPSSEFSPGWKRTFVGWSNYQTDLSVALAGKAGVSTVIPSDPEASQEVHETASDDAIPGSDGADPAPVRVEPVQPLEPKPSPRRKVVPGKPPVVLEASPEGADAQRSRLAKIERIPTVSTGERAASSVPAAPGPEVDAAPAPSPQAAPAPSPQAPPVSSPQAAPAPSAEETPAPDLTVIPASSAKAAPSSGTGVASTPPPQVAEAERAPLPSAEEPPPRIKVAPASGVKVTPGAEALAGPSADAEAANEADQEEEDWSEVQIRRSLSAVGRTLGPSGGGASGAPPPTSDASPVELEDEVAPNAASPASPAAQAPEATPHEAVSQKPIGTLPTPPDARPVPLRPEPLRLEPVQPMPGGSEPARLEPFDAVSASSGMTAMVGGSRRRSRLPVRTIAVAAVGLIALLGGGWLVLERFGGARDASAGDGAPPPVLTGELPITGEGDASMAGVTIGQSPLFPRAADAVETAEAEFLWVGPEMFEAPTTEADENGGSPAGGGSTTDPAGNDVEVPGAPEPVEVASPPGTETQTRQRAEPASAVEVPPATPNPEAPTLEALQLDDPIVAAFEDALTIFRKEVSRYDSLRVEFDDQLAGCNALNLSYRAVREAYRRLDSRFEAARDRFAGPALQAYRSAERQVTVIDVHYDLSECPPPRGG